MQITKDDHWKFLKEKPILKLGDMIPNVAITQQENETITTYSLISEYLILLMYSTNCETCIDALEALDQFIDEYPGANVVLLINTDEDKFTYINSCFIDRMKVYKFSNERIFNELHTYGMPHGYTINALGQVIVSNSCNDIFWLRKLIEPYNK